jgi:hypothetical protein
MWLKVNPHIKHSISILGTGWWGKGDWAGSNAVEINRFNRTSTDSCFV